MLPQLKYIDIHTHSFYTDKETRLILNIFPEETEKSGLPAYFSVGLHPWHITESTWQTLVSQVKDMAGDKKVIAIGESGLDKVTKSSFETQIQVFKGHIEIAESFKKPLIIHCVRSYSEILAFRKKSDQHIPWIFHWFNSDMKVAEELIRKNCYLSFGHMLFNENSKAFKVFKDIPVDNIFFETDDAGFTIREVYARAALLRNLPVPALIKQIINNFGRCFQM
jgi:TatD DNase family protein